MDKTTNVTGTGIAVAIAVIVAIALIFLGPKIFTIFNTSTIATTTSQNQTEPVSNSTNNSTTMTDLSTSTPDSNALGAIPANPTQLMVKDEVIGTGTEARAGNTVTVNYVGMLTNGTVFDASANHSATGFTFPLGAGQVIKGWDEGVQGMKVGGKRELVIPASLGYGSQAVGPIPANSTLVFEIELLSVTPAQ